MIRRLRPEELDLWNRVAKTTERMDRPKAREDTKPGPKPRKPVVQPDPIPSFQVGQRSTTNAEPHDLMSSVSDRVRNAPVRMDRKTHTKMKRGKMSPEARIDLHGMTMDRAHPALTGFIMRSASEGIPAGSCHHRQRQGPGRRRPYSRSPRCPAPQRATLAQRTATVISGSANRPRPYQPWRRRGLLRLSAPYPLRVSALLGAVAALASAFHVHW